MVGLSIKSEYAQGNKLVYSEVQEYENQNAICNDLCVKYVVRGSEQYQLNNVTYTVGPGEFLLINPTQHHQEYVRSQAEVAGICMSISSSVLQDVYTHHCADTDVQLDNPIAFLTTPIEVYEGVYQANDANLGELFMSLQSAIPRCDFLLEDSFSFYSEVAEKLLRGQGIIQKKISQVKAERYITRKELYRRIEIGKKIIDQSFANHLDIENIASASAMSTFHFTRTFKQIFNISPYQYAIHRRLNAAKTHLTKKEYSISEIAFLVGFPDIFTFSKSFKNSFGISPSKFRALVH